MSHFASHVTQTPLRLLGMSMIAPGLLHLGQCRLILLVIVICAPCYLGDSDVTKLLLGLVQCSKNCSIAREQSPRRC